MFLFIVFSETDQEEPEGEHDIAHEVYPTLAPDAAKILYTMSKKIAENCRSVEQSRLMYRNEDPQSWGYYHLPLVRDVTQKKRQHQTISSRQRRHH